MKQILAIALLLAAFGAKAEHAASEPPLTPKQKAHLVQVLGESHHQP